MNLPDPNNGHTDIAHQLAEALMRVNITPLEYRIIWAIWRKTYGWHKDTEAIPLRMFEKMTRLDRRNITRVIYRLEEKRMIKVERGHKVNYYQFNLNYLTWKVDASLEDVGRRYTETVYTRPLKVVHLDTPVKEKKETIPKKSTHEVKEIFDYYDKHIRYRKRREQKHRVMITLCLKRFSVDELKMAIDGIASSEYHMKKKLFEMERIFLSSYRVEKCIDLYRENRKEPPWILQD